MKILVFDGEIPTEIGIQCLFGTLNFVIMATYAYLCRSDPGYVYNSLH